MTQEKDDPAQIDPAEESTQHGAQPHHRLDASDPARTPQGDEHQQVATVAGGDQQRVDTGAANEEKPSRPDLLATAHALLDAGLSVVPTKTDGSKAPSLGKNWDGYHKKPPTREQVDKWFTGTRFDGLGFFNGAVSGNTECVEFEGRAVGEGIFAKFKQRMKERGLEELFNRIFDGWSEESPSGGVHLHYRLTDGTAKQNTKLAQRPSTPEELAAHPETKTQTLIETRGERGFIITAPSFGRTLDRTKHSKGSSWKLVKGGPESIAEIASAERNALWEIAEEFHQVGQMPEKDPESISPPSSPVDSGFDSLLARVFTDSTWQGVSPFDDFKGRVTWRHLLEPDGWKWQRNDGERDYWTRPGKHDGVSASTIEDGPLYVFSTSTELPVEEGLSKGHYYAETRHGGDLSAAARDLYEQGYGEKQSGHKKQNTDDRNEDTNNGSRHVKLTRASDITIKPVTWLWDQRLAVGTIGLLAGREGEGKSTIAAWIIAAVTTGTLPGHHHGTPKSACISATEDSWESTIVPRLMAAGADLERVYRIDVITSIGVHGDLSMPQDIPAMKNLAIEHDTALLVLDPLMSRLQSGIDSHKDAEVRTALEPLAAFADEAGVSVIGLMHFNKGATNDPLNAVMASKAFTAVARSVHTVIRDADDGNTRYFGTPKNNLGRDDLPLLTFTISGHPIDTESGTVWTSKSIWGEEVQESVRDVMARATDTTDRTATEEASEWLVDYMLTQGGRVDSADAKKAGRAAGHSESAIKRARNRLKIVTRSEGFPRKTVWLSPEIVGDEAEMVASVGSQSAHASQGSDPTELTELTEPTGISVGPVGPVGSSPQDDEPTEVLALEEHQTPTSPTHGCSGASCRTIGCPAGGQLETLPPKCL